MSHVAAIVLAAGLSRRFGAGNKLTADADGQPLVRRVVEQALASRAAQIVVVTGHEPDAIASALAGLPLRVVHNAHYRQGMGTSVAAGVASLDANMAGALVLLGDMPDVDAVLLDRLMQGFAEAGADRIVMPVDTDGRQRNPVLWPRRLFAALARLDGDKGGRDLIAAEGASVVRLAVADASAVSLDIDTPEALAAWRAGCRSDGGSPPAQD